MAPLMAGQPPPPFPFDFSRIPIALWIEAIKAVLLVKVWHSEVTMALRYPPLIEIRPQKELVPAFAYPFHAPTSPQRPRAEPQVR